jgi:hypothetical protein
MGLPEALVKAVSINRHNEPGKLSATTMLNGTKQIIIRDRHWDELEEDVADHFYALYGSTAHKMLEDEGQDEFTEEFVAYDVDGITVTGRIDNYNMRKEMIADYKTASVWKVRYRNFDDWHRQGMIYAWLLIKNGFEVRKCQFIAILKDHSKRDAKRDSSYPQKPVYVYEFDVTEEGLAEIQTFIEEKISHYKLCIEMADNDIPPCTSEERWEKPTKYAVMKEGRKSAVRVMDTKEGAEKLAADLGKNHSVQIRPGESTRCAEYCSCNGFCNFFRDTAPAAEDPDVNWP